MASSSSSTSSSSSANTKFDPKNIHLHGVMCPYRNWDTRHRNSLLSKDSLKESFTKHFGRKTPKKSEKEIKREVKKAMESKLINTYLANQKIIYDGYKDVVIAMCICKLDGLSAPSESASGIKNETQPPPCSPTPPQEVSTDCLQDGEVKEVSTDCLQEGEVKEVSTDCLQQGEVKEVSTDCLQEGEVKEVSTDCPQEGEVIEVSTDCPQEGVVMEHDGDDKVCLEEDLNLSESDSDSEVGVVSTTPSTSADLFKKLYPIDEEEELDYEYDEDELQCS